MPKHEDLVRVCRPPFLSDPDAVKAENAMRAMLSMNKMDIAALKKAAVVI